MYRNVNVKCAFIISYHLVKLVQIENDLLNSNLKLATQGTLSFKINSDINLFSTKLITMLKLIFKNSDDNNLKDSNELKINLKQLNDLNLSQHYTNMDLFNLFDNTQQTSTHKLFNLLINMFKLFYLKASSIYSNNLQSKPSASTTSANINPAETKPNAQASQLESQSLTKIKNIDDPSSDEETVASENTKTTADPPATTNVIANNEDSEDFLLIGSWFEDQLAANANTVSTNANNNPSTNNLTVIEITANANNQNEHNFPVVGINTSNETQVLDTTFELDTFSNQNTLNGVS